MSDLQSKVGDGLTKLQDRVQQGKQMLVTAQEMGQLRKQSTDAASKRMELIVSLGEEAYTLYRKGVLALPHMQATIEQLTQSDTLIFEVNQALALHAQNQNTENKCECGASLQASDKFCGSCGKAVIKPEAPTQHNTLQCPTCEMMIRSDATYCGCCGNKVG
ncbi:hypothetical protein A374_15853 [Fictibacillus macauensis ZFHKF-1]|uniref:Uncharacterized protein n=1 Tax=Fictibacillus macauensis ZFHKF-1 TaxID=1196324 RepID=I8UBF9_9BACL|nr:zinc ribbon domain-containing protein [Fictibacillus macauensis]EIT84275.1 hypothetical protein A374_15853 [Fictibacillus macauensis ZFHKF-1]